MTPPDDDLPPATPAESLRVIAEQREAAERKLQGDPLTFFGPWGLAWLLGFAVMFLRYGPDDRVFVPMPDWLPLALLTALLIAAGVVSGVLAGRTYRHVHGPSSVQGAMYGYSWFIAFCGIGLVLQRFSDLLPPGELGLMWASVMVALTGALHMAGGAIWQQSLLFAVGAWITLINVLGTVLGPGWHSLVISLGGGGAMLGVGLALRARRSKSASTAAP